MGGGWEGGAGRVGGTGQVGGGELAEGSGCGWGTDSRSRQPFNGG